MLCNLYILHETLACGVLTDNSSFSENRLFMSTYPQRSQSTSKVMKRSFLTCAVFLLVSVAAVRVEAFTVQEISVTPYQIANITVDGFWSGNVYAGINNLVVDGTPMTGFCIDPFHFSRDSSPGYDYVSLEDAPKNGNGGSSMGADTAKAISGLWAMYYAPNMSATNAAGLQIAIWMLVGGSKFHVVNDFGASALIASLSTYTGPGADLIGLTGPGQDYVVFNPVPDGGATVMLLGTVLVALAIGARFRAPAAQAARSVSSAAAPPDRS